jgi:hypothetical protein
MVITDHSAEALISDIALVSTLRKGRLRSRKKIEPRKTKWVKVGDALGEFQVAEIRPDGVLLKAGSTTFNLLLYDGEKIKNRAPARPKEGPRVVGLAEEKPGIGGKKEKGSLPVPIKEGSKTSIGRFTSESGREKRCTGKPNSSKAQGAADNYEAFLKRTGNKRQLEVYQSQNLLKPK